MTEQSPLLAARDLSVRFRTRDGVVQAVSNLSYTLHRGDTLGIVGESGSGKSMTALAAMGLVTYVLFPAAPPWLAGHHGYLPEVFRINHAVVNNLPVPKAGAMFQQGTTWANDVAAVPSLHAAYTMLIFLFLWPRLSRRWRPLLAAYPIGMALSLMYLGEHYLIDIVLGWAYAAVAIYVVNWAADRRAEDSQVRETLLAELEAFYRPRGVNVMRVANGWTLRTAPDLAPRLKLERKVGRKLSRAAVETLAIVAYHQPVTRAEIEEIRGVVTATGTLDVLLKTGWIRLRGRRKAPGRPITYGTTEAFLSHFGLEEVGDLPGLE